MSTKHAKYAETYLKNDDVASRHDRTFFGVREKRDRMAHDLPEWEDLRSAADNIKRHTVTHLADYLEKFESNARKNGVTVHWAADSESSASDPLTAPSFQMGHSSISSSVRSMGTC